MHPTLQTLHPPIADLPVGFQLVFVPIIIAITLVAVWYNHQKQKKRTQAMLELSQTLQGTFTPGRDSFHDDQYAHFEIFRQGFDRAAFNTITGTLQIDRRHFDCKLGDFRFKRREGSGKHRRTVTYNFSYVIIHLPFLTFPDVLIRREGMFDKLKSAFGYDDIDFESAEFSRKFYVSSNNKKFAYDLCHQRMIEFLLRSDPPTIDIENARVLLADGNHQWTPERFLAKLAFFEQFADQIPDHLLKQLEHNQSPAGNMRSETKVYRIR